MRKTFYSCKLTVGVMVVCFALNQIRYTVLLVDQMHGRNVELDGVKQRVYREDARAKDCLKFMWKATILDFDTARICTQNVALLTLLIQESNYTCRRPELRALETPHPAVALASYPGSGNTWARHLLQQITGIGTSSLYCDEMLRKHGFPQECLPGNVTLVRKTHEPPSEEFSKAVLLVRNPYDAILSLYKFNRFGHVYDPRIAWYTRQDGAVWRRFVVREIRKWFTFNVQWLLSFDNPLHVVFYEDVRRDTLWQLLQITTFLNRQATYRDLYCASVNGEGMFHRKPSQVLAGSNFTLYNDGISAIVDAYINKFRSIMAAVFNVTVPF